MAFETGQTWLWQARFEPECWVLWHVIEVQRNILRVVTLASGSIQESNDEPGSVYNLVSECIMATTSERMA